MDSVTQNPLVVRAGTGRLGDLGDHRGHLLLSAETTGGRFSLFAVEVDPDGGILPQIHAREDEALYVQSGRFEFLVGQQTVEVGPGDTVFAPRNVPHAWRCISAEGGRALIFVTPGDNFERFAFAMAEAGIVPSDPDGVARLLALTSRHGIEMLPPGK